MDSNGIKTIIAQNPYLKEKLFARGFLLTDAELNAFDYPFYGLWEETKLGRYSIFTAKGMTCFRIAFGDATAAFVGHVYNPFTMVYQEEEILRDLLILYMENREQFWDSLNELTGVFCLFIVHGNDLLTIGDPSGMLTVFYTCVGKSTYISSHTNLIGDLLKLEWDPYVVELAKYRFFKLLGNALPGNLTQFNDVKRLIPNHCLHSKNQVFTIERFYWPRKQLKNREQIVEEAGKILHSNLNLIVKKWDKPAISVTGGCDSKTTLACTNGLYDQFNYFSYISSTEEEVDAVAAEIICTAIGQKHTTYHIPDRNEFSKDFDVVREILNWNTGNLRYSNPNDIRKRIYFSDRNDFDLEVKSWASEIGRAYYSKRFHGRSDFGNDPTPRKCTTLYKFFFHNRKLVRKTDRVFEEYLNRYFERADENPIEWQEQFFWEFRVPSWNGLVITGEHRYSFDITIPYNNRRLLELLLSAPIEDRINDTVYKNIREKMNPMIDQTGIAITNLKHTENREKAENIYYVLHSNLKL